MTTSPTGPTVPSVPPVSDPDGRRPAPAAARPHVLVVLRPLRPLRPLCPTFLPLPVPGVRGGRRGPRWW